MLANLHLVPWFIIRQGFQLAASGLHAARESILPFPEIYVNAFTLFKKGGKKIKKKL
jgi:hypothetical protein